MGPNHDGYYMGLSQNRDSDALTRSNFTAALELLGGETECTHIWSQCNCAVRVIHDSHWAVGWIDYILVHESAADKVAILAGIEEKLEIYPVLDEDAFSQLEWDEATETLENNAQEFRRELLRYLEFKNPEMDVRPARAKALDEIADRVYRYAAGYSGPENAWVSAESIKRWCESGEAHFFQLDMAGNRFISAMMRCGVIPAKSA